MILKNEVSYNVGGAGFVYCYYSTCSILVLERGVLGPEVSTVCTRHLLQYRYTVMNRESLDYWIIRGPR